MKLRICVVAMCVMIIVASLQNEARMLDLSLKEKRLGDPCRSSHECFHFMHDSHCDMMKRMCTCLPFRIQFNDTTCLSPASLDSECSVDAQCEMKVKNSECGEDQLCQCKENFLPFRKAICLSPAKIGDYCLNNRQCKMASIFSFCKYIIPDMYGKCECPLGYTTRKDGQCLPHLGEHCETDYDCLSITRNSTCMPRGNSYQCQCAAGFKPSANKMACYVDQESQDVLHPVSLGKSCQSSSQCKARDPNSECMEGKCECVKKSATCSSSHTQCLNDTFQCNDGHCISWYFVCDGELNCLDGSDEKDCLPFNCPKESYQCDDGTCLPRSAVCNGWEECPDASDEARCSMLSATGVPCDKNAFRCKDGQCRPMSAFCNSFVDCYDGSDEDFRFCESGMPCPADSFRCNNGRCKSTAFLCNAINDCGDYSDEVGCSVCLCDAP